MTKHKERCPWLLFLCTTMPVWYRGASSKETWGVFLHATAWRTNVGFFQRDKKVGGAVGPSFPSPLCSWRISVFLTGAQMRSLIFYLLQLCCGDCPLQWRVSPVGNIYREEENNLFKTNKKKENIVPPVRCLFCGCVSIICLSRFHYRKCKTPKRVLKYANPYLGRKWKRLIYSLISNPCGLPCCMLGHK